MKDKTLEETFETVLHAAGVENSGELAVALLEAYHDWVEDVFLSLWRQAAKKSGTHVKVSQEVKD